MSCGALRADVGQGLADAGHAEHDGAAPPDSGDSLLNLGAVLGCQIAEVGLDPADEPPDAADLLGEVRRLYPTLSRSLSKSSIVRHPSMSMTSRAMLRVRKSLNT